MGQVIVVYYAKFISQVQVFQSRPQEKSQTEVQGNLDLDGRSIGNEAIENDDDSDGGEIGASKFQISKETPIAEIMERTKVRYFLPFTRVSSRWMFPFVCRL